LTFALVCVAWVFFRADGFERAFGLVASMLGLYRGATAEPLTAWHMAVVCTVCGLMLVFHWVMRNTSIERAALKLPWWVGSIILSVMILLIVVSSSGVDNAFIYFQF